MTNLKMFWLFIFLNYIAHDAAAQNTSPAALAGSHVEALSQNNLEVHVKGNLSGHIELTTLEVISTTFPNNETLTETVYEKGKTSDESSLAEDILENPFNSEENVEYSSEDKSSDVNVYSQSASPLSYTDNSENYEEAAAKQLTDGFKSNDVINGSETSGNIVAINEEHGSETPATNWRAPLSENYNSMNDADEKDSFNAADEGISTTDINDEENLFTESDGESDESLFELNDPIEENWFGINLEEQANTYSPSKSISELDDISKLLTQTSTEVALDLSQYSTEISIIETVNGQRIERKLQTNETILIPDDILTITPSADYSEEINDNGDKIENSDSLSISENVFLSESTTPIANLEHDSNDASELEHEESDTVEIILEGDKDEYINEYDKNDKTISPAIILPATDATEINLLENNEDFTTIAAVNDLSIEEIDENTGSENIPDSAESDEDGPKIYFYNFSTESPNEDIPSEINEDRIEKESTETDPAYAHEDSTEILPVNIDTGFTIGTHSTTAVNELVTELNPATVLSIADSFTESISSEEDIPNENMEFSAGSIMVSPKQNSWEDILGITTLEYNESSTSETFKEDERKLESEVLVTTEVIDKNENNLKDVSMENESTQDDFKTVDKLTTLMFSKEGSLLTPEAIDVGTESSEFQATVSPISSNEILDDLYTTGNILTSSETGPVDTVNETENKIPAFGILEEFDIVEPEGFSNDISDTTNLSSMSTDSVESEEYIDSIEGDPKNIENIVTENSNIDVILPDKATDESLSENTRDLTTITNNFSDGSDLIDNEEHVTEENHEEISEEFPFVSVEDRITLHTETASTEGAIESEIILEPTTEVNSDKTVLTEESDSAESEEYGTEGSQRGFSEEFPSAPSKEEVTESEITVQSTTEVNSVKIILSEESDSVESEEYVIKENQREIFEEFSPAPLDTSSIELNSVTLDTETASKEEEIESEIILEPTTEVNSDKTVQTEESDSVESEEYVTEENQIRISEEFPSAPLETTSIEIDSVTLDTETASKEEATESEITVQPTTEVNSDKIILSEESESVESEEYVIKENQREISEEFSPAPLDTSSIELNSVTLDTETASKEEEIESEIILEPTTEVNSDKTVQTEESDSVESEEYVTEENQIRISEEFPSAHLETSSIEIDSVTLDTETASKEEATESEITVQPTTEVNSDKIILSEELDSVKNEENATEKMYQEILKELSSNESIPDTLPLIDSTEAVSNKEEMERGLTFAPTTEVNPDEIIQSEESDLVESEEFATQENNEDIPKDFPSNRNLSVPVKGVYGIDENNFKLDNFFTGLEISAIEANRAAVDTEAASKEMGSEITLELTTKVTEIIQFEKSDSVESEELITEKSYEGVPEEFPSNGNFPDVFPSIDPTEVVPVESIYELEPITAVTTDTIIQSKENISEILESSGKLNSDTKNFNSSETSTSTNEDTSFSLYKKSNNSLNHTVAEVTIKNGTLDFILNYLFQRVLTNMHITNLTESSTSVIKDKNKNNYSDEGTSEKYDEEGEGDTTVNTSEEIYSEESDITAEDLSGEKISDVEHVPYIHGKAFENDVNVTIKIVAEETTFYVPPYAYLLEDLDNLVLNITWASSNKILNNSLSLTLTQISMYYVINGVQLNIVRDNEMLIWKKNVVILPKRTDKSGEYDCVIEFEDGVEVSISNTDFLSKSSEEDNLNNSDVHSSTSEMKGKRIYHIEITVGCMAIALMLFATIYFAIRKAKKRTLKIRDLSAQHIVA